MIFFLFDDLLILCKLCKLSQQNADGQATTVKFRTALDLRCLQVEAIPDNISK